MKNGIRGLFVFLSIAVVVLAMTAPMPVGAQIVSGDLVGTILDKTGAAKFDTGLQDAQTFMKAGSPVIALGLKLPLETLDPGSYRVALQAVDSAGNKSKARSAEFVVE